MTGVWGNLRSIWGFIIRNNEEENLIYSNSSALRLHCHKSMHTGCDSRSLAPAGLRIPLRMQRDTSRDSGRLNCNDLYDSGRKFSLIFLLESYILVIQTAVLCRNCRTLLFTGFSCILSDRYLSVSAFLLSLGPFGPVKTALSAKL